MRNNSISRRGFAWIELVLLLALMALVLQLLPFIDRQYLWVIDVRAWTSRTWFIANAVLFVSMFAIRFGSTLRAAARYALTQRKSVRVTSSVTHEHEKALSTTEEKALYQRMQEARKRQVV